MDAGTVLTVVLVGGFLLFLLFLPAIVRSSARNRPATRRDAEREAAYRRGFLIGSLMEQANELGRRDQGRRIEQAMIQQSFAEHHHQAHHQAHESSFGAFSSNNDHHQAHESSFGGFSDGNAHHHHH